MRANCDPKEPFIDKTREGESIEMGVPCKILEMHVCGLSSEDPKFVIVFDKADGPSDPLVLCFAAKTIKHLRQAIDLISKEKPGLI